MRRLRILLVEDDAVIGALLAELLTNFGHDICAIARTERDAVAAATRHAPDLMMVDAQLQAGSGVLAMDAILRRSAMPHIFMTGGSLQSLPATASVLHKPFGAAGLMAALEHVAAQCAQAWSATPGGR